MSVIVQSKAGEKLVALGLTRLGEDYDLGANVPLDDPDWHGPWDCAEFASWLVYQVLGERFGCVDNDQSIQRLEPYSMAWYRDANKDPGKLTISQAKKTPGAFLIRKEQHGKIGHVAMSDGEGGTIEAAGASKGVTTGKVDGLIWHVAVVLG